MEPGYDLNVAGLAGGGFAAAWTGSDGVMVQIYTQIRRTVRAAVRGLGGRIR